MKKKNQGFSLVELIVTIAILAIVVAPLLNAFVVSARTNAKAKERLRTTTIAQNIMEGVEKLTLEELAYQFDYPEERFNLMDGSVDACELVLPSGGGTTFNKVVTYEEAKAQVDAGGFEVEGWESMITSSIIRKSASDVRLAEKSNRDYYFFVKDISAGSGASKYSALITVKPSSANNYNDKDIAELQKIDITTDAIFIDGYTSSGAVALFPIEETTLPEPEESPADPDAPAAPARPAITLEDIERTVRVIIDKTDGVTTVKVEYEYAAVDSSGTTLTRKQESLIFDNAEDTSHELEHIYLMYFPWYVKGDEIVVNNDDNVDCTLHIIKQQGSDQIDSDDPRYSLTNRESNYRVKLYVNEGSPNANGTSHCNIQTNLKKNMGSGNAMNPIIHCQYNMNASGDVEDNVLQLRPLTAPTSQWDRIFDVTVNVYDNAVSLNTLYDAEPLATFTGGMTN